MYRSKKLDEAGQGKVLWYLIENILWDSCKDIGKLNKDPPTFENSMDTERFTQIMHN